MTDKISFTPAKIQKLKPKQKRYTVADSKTPHLVLLVYPKGRKTFCYYGRIDKPDPVYKAIGKFPDMSVDAARQEAIKIQDTLNQKKNPLKNSKLEKMYFSQCYEMYIEFKKITLSKNTIRDYQSYWRIHLQPVLEYKKVYEIDADLLQNLHLTMKDTPYQANRVIVLIKAIFNYLINKKGYVGTNPANAVELYEEKPKNVILFPDEIKKLLEVMSNKGSDKDFLWNMAILFLLIFGARSSNVLKMKWSEIDLDNMLWSVPVTKNKEPKIFTIPVVLLPFFNELKKYKIEGNDYVFPSEKSKSGHIFEVKKHLNNLMAEIGVTRHIRPHDLRHTYGTMSALLNHSPSIIQTELGHKTMNASNRYVNLANQMIASFRDETVGKILSGISPTSNPVLDKNQQPIYDDSTVAGQIANTMAKPKTEIYTEPAPVETIEKLYKEKNRKQQIEKVKAEYTDMLKNIKE